MKSLFANIILLLVVQTLAAQDVVIGNLKWVKIVPEHIPSLKTCVIDDSLNGNYSDLRIVRNNAGAVAIALVRDTTLTLLPTRRIPVRTLSGDTILYKQCILYDNNSRRVYFTGCDYDGRVYVYSFIFNPSISSSQSGGLWGIFASNSVVADEVFYYTDPLHDLGNANPFLTPGGNILIASGINNDNFYPKDSVYLLRFGSKEEFTETSLSDVLIRLFLMLIVVTIVGFAIMFVVKKFFS